jgi:hypothetical protein
MVARGGPIREANQDSAAARRVRIAVRRSESINHRHADFQYSVRFVGRILDSSICVDISQVLVHATYVIVLNLSICISAFLGLFTRKLHARIVNENRWQRAVERRAHDTNKLAFGDAIGNTTKEMQS